MRVVITGASGNVGSALVDRLGGQPEVGSVVGICRRPHEWRPPKTEWVFADVGHDDDLPALVEALRGADAVVHLAWLFQPTRRPEVTWRSNVLGTRNVLDAVTAAEVPSLVVASSVGTYSPRRSLEPVDESWPSHGVAQTAYSREKAYVERLLDAHEARHPDRRVVRLRPGFIFAERASTQQRRLFLGPLVPHRVLRPGLVPALPLPADLRLPALHARDVAAAYEAAVLRPVRGAFNVAADPVLGPEDLAGIFGARWVPVPAGVLRASLAAGYRARAVPASPQLFDLLMSIPVMSSERARSELGWSPEVPPADAVAGFLRGLSADSDVPTPPLADATSGPGRVHEAATGVGGEP
jgi:nucleoside-diphosphate-sugar epimerase